MKKHFYITTFKTFGSTTTFDWKHWIKNLFSTIKMKRNEAYTKRNSINFNWVFIDLKCVTKICYRITTNQAVRCDTFLPDLKKLQPYDLELLASSSDSSLDSDIGTPCSADKPNKERLGNMHWCQCGRWRPMENWQIMLCRNKRSTRRFIRRFKKFCLFFLIWQCNILTFRWMSFSLFYSMFQQIQLIRSGYELTVRTSHFAKQSLYFRKKCETNYAKKRKIAKLEVQYIFFLTLMYKNT